MRFPSQPGCIAGLTLYVPDLLAAQPFLHGVLHALGYGRTSGGEGWVLWAREGAQVLVQQAASADNAARGVGVQLRAASRADVDRLHARAVAENWRVIARPEERPYAAGYYSVALAGPAELDVVLEIIHAWDDLPDLQDGGERVRLPGADGIMLGGYLHRPRGAVLASVVVMPGYGSDATATSWAASRLARDGFAALSLSKRGWLGSGGAEDQGLRQPDDALEAAAWLRSQPGLDVPVALLGYSQGGQVALLAAARPRADLLAVAAFFPCTDLAGWARDTSEPGVAEYLADFVAPENLVSFHTGCP